MSSPSAVERAVVAAGGAAPWPQITPGLPLFTSKISTGTSPPGPFKCGSTICRVNAAATAASNALPPLSSIDMPTAVAIQCVEATTPNVPSISGRGVKGGGETGPGLGGAWRDLFVMERSADYAFRSPVTFAAAQTRL